MLISSWKTEFPTEPGFYWVRERTRGAGMESIVKIVKSPNEPCLYAHIIGFACMLLKQDFRNYEFLGPFTVETTSIIITKDKK